MFDAIFNAIAGVLSWFYDAVPDYSFAIVMLTLSIMLLFTPLTLAGARSMTKAQALQPELMRLRQQHRGDRQKLNEETMKLYQANGVSPLGGCLPNLVQLPIFFVLYRVIWNLRIPEENPVDNPFPRNLSEDSLLYQDLVADKGAMPSLGVDLARTPHQALAEDFVSGLPYLALIGVTFLLAWLQQRQMQARRSSGAAMPNRQMEMIMKYMPFMLPVFSYFFPAALIPYFIVSSVYRMGTQAFIHATMKPLRTDAASAKGSVIEASEASDPVSDTPVSDASPPPVQHQRSRKAIEADEARRAERERRAAERRRSAARRSPAEDPSAGDATANGQTGPRRERRPQPKPASRTGRSDGRAGNGRRSARNGARNSTKSTRNSTKNDRSARKAPRTTRKNDPKRAAPERPASIQSRRTAGDGRTRKRRSKS